MHPLKVSEELIKTYTQRRNSHLVSATGDGERSDEPDPYAFEEGDDEFSFTEKKDKLGAEREGSKKYKVSFCLNGTRPSLTLLEMKDNFMHVSAEGSGTGTVNNI